MPHSVAAGRALSRALASLAGFGARGWPDVAKEPERVVDVVARDRPAGEGHGQKMFAT